MRFVIDCSDKRNEYLFDALCKEGYAVSTYQNECGLAYPACKTEADEEEAPAACRTAVFLFAPSAELTEQDVSRIPAGSRIFCFRIGGDIAAALFKKNIAVHKYFDDELLAMKNAYLTAEGALGVIIQKTDRSVKDMRVLVLGGGRVGKSVAKLLHDNRCSVFVATVDPVEYAFASIFSDGVYRFDELFRHIGGFDLIVNTVPALILKGEALEKIKKDCLILDLASKPGGVDTKRAAELGLQTAHELGIPGRTAPRSAGMAIKDSVLKILSGSGAA